MRNSLSINIDQPQHYARKTHWEKKFMYQKKCTCRSCSFGLLICTYTNSTHRIVESLNEKKIDLIIYNFQNLTAYFFREINFTKFSWNWLHEKISFFWPIDQRTNNFFQFCSNKTCYNNNVNICTSEIWTVDDYYYTNK